jgi:hypothetical protein
MRWMGTLAVGVVAALVSPLEVLAAGEEFGKTEIGFSKEVQAVWNGCTYKVRVEQDKITGYPFPLFNIYGRVEADPSGVCQTAPASTLLGTSQNEPGILINVGPAGFTAAYTEWVSIRGMGPKARAHVVHVKPDVTGTVRHEHFSGGYLPPGGGAGGPGSASVLSIAVYNDSTLVVQGELGGNRVYYGESWSSVYAAGTATQYTAVFSQFFTSNQAPALYSY